MAFKQINQVKGLIRTIDPLGRIVIPKEIRNRMGIKESDLMEIIHYGDVVILRRPSEIRKHLNNK